MDLSTLEFTDSDRANLWSWHQRMLGEVPRSVQFAAKYNPDFLKAYRLKWENAFKGALPKQMMPLMMLQQRHRRSPRGHARSRLAGKGLGCDQALDRIHRTHLAHYFIGLEGLYAAEDALGDLLADWE